MQPPVFFAFLVFFVVPLTALVGSMALRSRLARRLLATFAAFSILMYLVRTLSLQDCDWNDFQFTACRHVPEWLYMPFSFAGLPFMAIFFVFGPIVLLIVYLIERRASR